MASFPSSWVIDVGEHSKSSRSQTAATSFTLEAPTSARKDRSNDTGRPSASFDPHLTPPATAFLGRTQISKPKSPADKSPRYPTCFPADWVLTPSMNTASSNSKPVYQDITRGASIYSPFTSHMAATTPTSASHTPTSSQLPVQALSLNPAESHNGGHSATARIQDNIRLEKFHTDPVVSEVKDKQEETSMWLQTLEQIHPEQEYKGSLAIRSESTTEVGNVVGDYDDLSDYSGLGDAPHNAPDVSDTYSMYA